MYSATLQKPLYLFFTQGRLSRRRLLGVEQQIAELPDTPGRHLSQGLPLRRILREGAPHLLDNVAVLGAGLGNELDSGGDDVVPHVIACLEEGDYNYFNKKKVGIFSCKKNLNYFLES